MGSFPRSPLNRRYIGVLIPRYGIKSRARGPIDVCTLADVWDAGFRVTCRSAAVFITRRSSLAVQTVKRLHEDVSARHGLAYEFLIMEVLNRVRRVLRARGAGAALCLIVSTMVDYLYDVRYGTDTNSWVGLEELTIVGDNRTHGEMYQGSRYLGLTKMFRQLSLLNEHSVLVDFGCGKGKVLLVASEFGIREARGVEFSRELCAIADRNCSIYQARTKCKTKFCIIESDAANYLISGLSHFLSG